MRRDLVIVLVSTFATSGTLTVSRSGNYTDGFILSIPEENILEIPYGDAEALQKIIEHR